MSEVSLILNKRITQPVTLHKGEAERKEKSTMEIQRIGIIGVGLMGAGIAEVCARTGYDTLVREINDELLAKGLDRIETSMQSAVQRGKLKSADQEAARSRLRGTTRLEDFADRDLVIEAAIEDLHLKQELFAQLDQICPPH